MMSVCSMLTSDTKELSFDAKFKLVSCIFERDATIFAEMFLSGDQIFSLRKRMAIVSAYRSCNKDTSKEKQFAFTDQGFVINDVVIISAKEVELAMTQECVPTRLMAICTLTTSKLQACEMEFAHVESFIVSGGLAGLSTGAKDTVLVHLKKYLKRNSKHEKMQMFLEKIMEHCFSMDPTLDIDVILPHLDLILMMIKMPEFPTQEHNEVIFNGAGNFLTSPWVKVRDCAVRILTSIEWLGDFEPGIILRDYLLLDEGVPMEKAVAKMRVNTHHYMKHQNGNARESIAKWRDKDTTHDILDMIEKRICECKEIPEVKVEWIHAQGYDLIMNSTHILQILFLFHCHITLVLQKNNESTPESKAVSDSSALPILVRVMSITHGLLESLSDTIYQLPECKRECQDVLKMCFDVLEWSADRGHPIADVLGKDYRSPCLVKATCGCIAEIAKRLPTCFEGIPTNFLDRLVDTLLVSTRAGCLSALQGVISTLALNLNKDKFTEVLQAKARSLVDCVFKETGSVDLPPVDRQSGGLPLAVTALLHGELVDSKYVNSFLNNIMRNIQLPIVTFCKQWITIKEPLSERHRMKCVRGFHFLMAFLKDQHLHRHCRKKYADAFKLSIGAVRTNDWQVFLHKFSFLQNSQRTSNLIFIFLQLCFWF